MNRIKNKFQFLYRNLMKKKLNKNFSIFFFFFFNLTYICFYYFIPHYCLNLYCLKVLIKVKSFDEESIQIHDSMHDSISFQSFLYKFNAYSFYQLNKNVGYEFQLAHTKLNQSVNHFHRGKIN